MNLENYESVEFVLSALEEDGVLFDSCCRDRVEAHLSLVRAYGGPFGLVSSGDLERGALQHVVDSLSLVRYVGEATRGGAQRYVDVGTGGGFPGIVCASCLPTVGTTLVERSEKKCAFLRRAVGELGLEFVKIFCGDFAKFEWGEEVSVVSVRGLERAEEQLPVLLGHLSPGSGCYWMTGPEARMDFGERFHVEQIVDGWSDWGLRRGALFSIRVV